MNNEILFALILVFIAGIAIHAYSMGWDAGHNAHHAGKPKPPKPVKGPTSLWQ